jgi:hypothetical protein
MIRLHDGVIIRMHSARAQEERQEKKKVANPKAMHG